MTLVTTETPTPSPFWEIVVGRLSALSEPAILNWFWGLIGFTECDPDLRMGLLLMLGQVVITRPDIWDFAAMRDAHAFQRYRFGPNRRCFVCGTGRRVYFHHIIEVQNGGDNAFRNQIALCFSCHQYLHPWLAEPDAQWDFIQLGTILNSVVQNLFGGGGTGPSGLRVSVPSPTRTRCDSPFEEIHHKIRDDARVHSQRPRRTEDIE